jgi:hypothetical protein
MSWHTCSNCNGTGRPKNELYSDEGGNCRFCYGRGQIDTGPMGSAIDTIRDVLRGGPATHNNSGKSRGIGRGCCGCLVLILALLFWRWLNTPQYGSVTHTATSSDVVGEQTSKAGENQGLPKIVSADFSSGLSSEWEIISGRWLTVNRELTMLPSVSEITRGVVLIGKNDWKDYEIRVTVNLQNSDDAAFILVRAADATHNMHLILERGRGEWRGESGSQWWTMPNTMIEGLPTDKSFEVRVRALGSQISTYIDGRKVNEWSGAFYSRGRTGLKIKAIGTDRVPSFGRFEVFAESK